MFLASFWPKRVSIRAASSIILGALPYLALVPFGFGSEPSPFAGAGTRLASRHAAAERVKERFPLHFIENKGQVDSRAAYYLHGSDKAFYFGPEGVTIVLSKTGARQAAQPSARPVSLGAEEWIGGGSILRTAVTLEFVGANASSKLEGAELSPARLSYFMGSRENWKVGLRTYQKLVYADLWPGIDLVYTVSAERLKYKFVVRPGADPDRIRLRYRGAATVSLDNEGKLRVRTRLDDFQDDRPTAHQDIDGRVVGVDARYALLPGTADDGHAYGFAVGAYDSTNVLVIDPAILVYAGFIGGTGDDRGNAIAVDVNGNAYITGETNSLQSSFPVAGGLDVGHNGAVDAFVAKVDPTGTQLLYAGFIGGAGDDRGKSIAVDSLGNAYITGETSSDQSSFPVNGGPDVTYNGGIDAFVAKINAAGTNLVYAGYIGGLNADRGTGIAVDSSNRAYVTGETASSGASFPNGGGISGLINSFDSSHNGGLDAFVVRVAANGASLEYAGYIGGIGADRGTSIAVDSSNRAYVTGETNSSGASFPNGGGFAGLTTFDSTINGDFDAFVARVGADGLSLGYAGYVGGSLADKGNSIIVDGAGNAYITGETSSGATSFPAGNGLGGLPGPGQVQKGGVDAFVAKISAAGTNLLYAGYVGGNADDRGNAIALAPGCVNNCDVYVAGETSSNQSSFPVSVGPDLTHNGGVDAFVAKINGD